MTDKKIEINIVFADDKLKESSNLSKRVFGAAMYGLGSAAVLAAIHPVLLSTNATPSQLLATAVVSTIYGYLSSSKEESVVSRPKRKM